MWHFNISLWLICFLLFTHTSGFGQLQYSEESILSKTDSIKAMSIPELKLPESYLSGKKVDLPWKLNNAKLPYFRPIFQQISASCGQASGIAYNFTYEINCARNLEALYIENQYPTQFAWNFMNGGSGWRGVSYFHSFDLLESCGTPSIKTYGGLAEGGDLRWMSGYEEYFGAMKNRIDGINYIDISTSDGLLTLKHWLNDHMNGSEFGGVASFYAVSPYIFKILPPDTPEAGKHVIINWTGLATHAMTIVGYNDSVRFDYNSDGQFTNNIDINGDNIVDMNDWEIGALLFANSYGETWADSGFCYMMYRTLAFEYGDGGIWNNAVHVINVKEDYNPLLTMRVKLKYNSREKIKIIAGVSSDTSSTTAGFSMDFPLLNFQGGNMPLQGLEANDTLDPQIMEVELDVTPLLGYVEQNKDAKYFLQIVENDPKGHGWGEVLYFSLIDRTSGINEMINPLTPLPINNNSITNLSIVSKVLFDKTKIVTEELPVWNANENYATTLDATGGQSPYHWSLVQTYLLNSIEKDFPEINGNKVVFGDQDVGIQNFDLAFPFPYYGDTMHRVTVALDGSISFEGEDFAYPYYFGEPTLLTKRKVVAPFMANLWLRNNFSNGVWVESTSTYFQVIWKATYNHYNAVVDGDFNFALRLFPDGRIETYYGDFEIPSYVGWVAGISNGDNTNYTLNEFSHHLQNPNGSSFEYIPSQLPDYVKITDDGQLYISGVTEDIIYNISAQVKDNNRVIDQKTFQLSSGMIFNFEINSGSDDRIDFYDTTSLSLIVKNISSETIENVSFQGFIEDVDVDVLKSGLNLGSFAAGETKQIDSAVVFTMSETIQDQYNITVNTQLASEENTWTSDVCLIAAAMNLKVVDVVVLNENNGLLEPGETADLQIEIQNLGHASGNNLNFQFKSNSNYLKVNTALQNIDFLPIGRHATLNFNVTTIDWTPSGITIPSVMELISGDENIQSINLPLTIGKVPVLVLNLEEGSASADHFVNIFDSLHLQYEFRTTIPEYLEGYSSIFICLGEMFNNYSLTWDEGNKLNGFLNDGGMIYMEGMRAWLEDAPTPVHEKFNLNVVNSGNYFPFDSVYGVDGKLTNGIVMDYFGDMSFINHYFQPQGSAYAFLRTSINDSACAIANDASTYKTIASSVMFGSMANSASSLSTAEYVNAILEFFEITIQVEGIAENGLSETPLRFEVYPNPFVNQLTMKFHSSNEENAVFKIYDLNGRLIKVEHLPFIYPNQSVDLTWDGHNEKGERQLPGIYFINYSAGNKSTTRKVILQ